MNDFVNNYYEYIDNFSQVYPDDKKSITNEKNRVKNRLKTGNVKTKILYKIGVIKDQREEQNKKIKEEQNKKKKKNKISK
jgi:2-methylcitrate dehydratase PrpD